MREGERMSPFTSRGPSLPTSHVFSPWVIVCSLANQRTTSFLLVTKSNLILLTAHHSRIEIHSLVLVRVDGVGEWHRRRRQRASQESRLLLFFLPPWLAWPTLILLLLGKCSPPSLSLQTPHLSYLGEAGAAGTAFHLTPSPGCQNQKVRRNPRSHLM